MKIQCHEKDLQLICGFLKGWMPQESELTRQDVGGGIQASVPGMCMLGLSFKESDPLYLDVDAAELANCFMELNKKGFVQSAKALIVGDHFYRSDTGKCPRCWRYRPEIHWNNENLKECNAELCDRCMDAVK